MKKAKECTVPLSAERERMRFCCYALSCADGDNQHQLWLWGVQLHEKRAAVSL